MTYVALNESDEREDCPACEHPWYLHSDACCTQELCSCIKGVFRAWALSPEEYERRGYGSSANGEEGP
jgi:hypothetical protein